MLNFWHLILELIYNCGCWHHHQKWHHFLWALVISSANHLNNSIHFIMLLWELDDYRALRKDSRVQLLQDKVSCAVIIIASQFTHLLALFEPEEYSKIMFSGLPRTHEWLSWPPNSRESHKVHGSAYTWEQSPWHCGGEAEPSQTVIQEVEVSLLNSLMPSLPQGGRDY